MAIKNIKGMLMDFAPQNVDAIVLFISSGFNTRNSLWLFDIPNKKENLLSLDGHNEIPEKPWLLNQDTLFEIKSSVFKKLKFIYIYSNPSDKKAYSGFSSIESSIKRSLDRLSMYNIKSLAYILIPATENPELINSNEDDSKCARLMIETIQDWMKKNRELDVFLVDRVGDFENII